MRTASNEFYNYLERGGAVFYPTVRIDFADGRRINLDKDDFYIDGQTFTYGAGTSSFPLGEAVGSSVLFSIVNDDERYDDYDFIFAKFTVVCNCDLPSGITEQWQFGTFTVVDPEVYGDCIQITAINDMYKGDKDFDSLLTFPATVGEILRESCRVCGVTLQTTTFANDDYVIPEKPENMTHRQIWGGIAMLAGGNAIMDEYNRLYIKPWEFFNRSGWRDGGKFDLYTPYKTGDAVDGGTFRFNDGDTADGGTFGDRKNLHIFHYNMDIVPSTDDVTITGIQTIIDKEKYVAGEEGYIIEVPPEFIKGDPQDAVNRIASQVIGGSFRVVELNYTSYPLAEFGDTFICVDWKGNYFVGILTDYEFNFNGRSILKCSAQSPIRNSSRYASVNTQTIQTARKEADKSIQAYDQAIQALTDLMSKAFGIFKTEEKQKNGSVIYYLHDRVELENSRTIWKMTADGFAVSTDGGHTWNAGIDSKGNAVVNVLSAIGINFDWANGGTLTLGGHDNGNGVMKVKDEYSTEIIKIDKDGVSVRNANGVERVRLDETGMVIEQSTWEPNMPAFRYKYGDSETTFSDGISIQGVSTGYGYKRVCEVNGNVINLGVKNTSTGDFITKVSIVNGDNDPYYPSRNDASVAVFGNIQAKEFWTSDGGLSERSIGSNTVKSINFSTNGIDFETFDGTKYTVRITQ